MAADTPHVWKGIEGLPVLQEAGVTEREGVVRVPYKRLDGIEHNAKLFHRRRSWWETPSLPLLPLGLETLPPVEAAAECALLVAEGESDALALRAAFGGVTEDNPVRGYFVLGLPGALTWRTEWRRYLTPFPLVYLLGDGDVAGREMNARIKRDVPWAKPVWLPEGEDARSILQRDGSGALDPYLGQADAVALVAHGLRTAPTLADFEALFVDQGGMRHAA